MGKRQARQRPDGNRPYAHLRENVAIDPELQGRVYAGHQGIIDALVSGDEVQAPESDRSSPGCNPGRPAPHLRELLEALLTPDYWLEVLAERGLKEPGTVLISGTVAMTGA